MFVAPRALNEPVSQSPPEQHACADAPPELARRQQRGLPDAPEITLRLRRRRG